MAAETEAMALDSHGSDEPSSREQQRVTRAPRKPAPVLEKDADELDLERLVLGDQANFRAQLFNDDTVLELERVHHSDDDEVASDASNSLEGLPDHDLFVLDTAPSGAPGRQGGWAGGVADEDAEASAWVDSDDERLVVSLASNTRLRKLRAFEGEDVVSGTEYARRLQQQYLRLHPAPAWALEAAETQRKRRRRADSGTSVESRSADDDSEADDEDGLGSARPIDQFLRNAKHVSISNPSKTKRLRPEVIDIQRSRDIPDTHSGPVSTLCFHPSYPVLLSTSTSSIMSLHHIDASAHPTPHPLLTSVQAKRLPLRRAEFVGLEGDKILFAGRRRFFQVWDLPSGVLHKNKNIQGHMLEHKTMERFRVDPTGSHVGIIASTRKGGGIVNIIRTDSMQWVAAARVDSRGGIADFCWWRRGGGMTILGRDGRVAEWDLSSRRTVGIWRDEGSTGATVLVLGGKQGPGALGGDKWVAVGSNSGVMNIYDRHMLLVPHAGNSAEDEVIVKERPEPTRRFEQLTTPVTVLAISPDAQLVAFGSQHKKDALRLAHLPSCTVYRNWPTDQTPLGRITSVAFGKQENTLAVGNDTGKIRLWDIRG